MKISSIDLGHSMKEVLRSLERNETVNIYYRGKLKGIIHPNKPNAKKKNRKKIQDHSFFGILANESDSVDEIMEQLRGSNRFVTKS